MNKISGIVHKFLNIIIFGVLLIALMVSCIKASPLPADSMPDIGIPMEKMNTHFRLSAPPSLNSYKIGKGGGIGLLGQLASDQAVAFHDDLGARMFIYHNGEWIELKNRILPSGYLKGIKVVRQGEDLHTEMATTIVNPVLPDPAKVTSIRIIAVGNLYKDGQVTDEQTAAYTDVTLVP